MTAVNSESSTTDSGTVHYTWTRVWYRWTTSEGLDWETWMGQKTREKNKRTK